MRRVFLVCRLCAALFMAVWAMGVCAEARVTVFAAASLQGVLSDVAELYPGPVAVSVGGSGMIARQVANGAPADAVVLANTDWMDWLEDQGLVEAARRTALLGNRLVLIAPTATPDLAEVSAESLLARLDGGRLAMGQTGGVPAGIYGRQWLETAGLWEAMSPHLAETDNVRAGLALVARQETPLGVVYATDAAADPSVQVVYEVPEAMHDPIIYPAAALTPGGAAFIAFLQSSAAREIFAAHGFTLAAAP
ncbi:molybdate ABC transporter substrate-binding protein [Roseovarius sp. S4756]|uniref:molybdate ABC transporter substrate-binding protein n=1 Tax=Roseovarius maritimus TaxID=3342637 RepID=UPI00372851B7